MIYELLEFNKKTKVYLLITDKSIKTGYFKGYKWINLK